MLILARIMSGIERTARIMEKERKIQPELAETLGQLADSLKESLREPGESASEPSLADTVRIRKPPRVYTTVMGQNIWMGEVESVELELEPSEGTNPYDSGVVDNPWDGVTK